MNFADNLWNESPQSWNAHGLSWEFTYSDLTAKRTITAPGFKLDIKITDTTKFTSPHLWLEAWAKKNKSRLPSQNSEAVTLELELFPSPKPPPETVEVEVVTDELTEEEERDRLFLERKVERAFYEAGRALRELRDRRLYRSTHKTFEEYCSDRFGFKRRHPYQLIDAANVVDNLIACAPTEESKMCANGAQNEMSPNGAQEKSSTIGAHEKTRTIGAQKEMVANGAQILPTSERQVRPLTKLEPEQQREAWTKAVESAGGKVPSGRIVSDVVQRIRERTRVPNPYRVGEVCQLIAKDDPELRGKGGCWCIVSEVHEFSCTVNTWEGEFTVRLSNLKSLEFSEEECQEMKVLCHRLHRLYSEEMEGTARAVVEIFGKLSRPELNSFEEKLLEFLEAQKY